MAKVKHPKWVEQVTLPSDSYSPGIIQQSLGTRVWVRECPTKPDWISARNTEVYVKNKKKSRLLISVGESWTYGDNFQGVQSGLGRDNITYRVNHSFASHSAKMLDSDLILSAVPGNCNQNMLQDLDRLLEEYSVLYEEVFVQLQLTSPGRDQSKIEDKHRLLKGYDNLYTTKQTLTNKMTDAEWFQAYDTMMLTEYDRILKLHTNVNGLVWKNFNPFQVDFNTESFIIVTCPWVRLTSQMHGNVFDLPVINEAGWWTEHYSTYGNVEGKQEYMMKQLDNLEASNKLLKTSSLNGFHPNETFHAIWALYILGKTEWVTL